MMGIGIKPFHHLFQALRPFSFFIKLPSGLLLGIGDFFDARNGFFIVGVDFQHFAAGPQRVASCRGGEVAHIKVNIGEIQQIFDFCLLFLGEFLDNRRRGQRRGNEDTQPGAMPMLPDAVRAQIAAAIED